MITTHNSNYTHSAGLLLLGLFFILQPERTVAANQVKALLEPPEHATLSAEIPGRILRMPFETGEPFKKGDLLIEFDCSLTKAERKVVESQLSAAEARLEFQQELESLQSSGMLDLKLTQANYNEIKNKLSLIDIGLDKCTITAPFSGHLLQRYTEPYESVKLYDPLLRIAKTDYYHVRMIVPVEWRSWLKKDLPFTFSSLNQTEEAIGKVLRLGTDVDPASQTFQVIGLLQVDTNLFLPGIAGTVSFEPDNILQ